MATRIVKQFWIPITMLGWALVGTAVIAGCGDVWHWEFVGTALLLGGFGGLVGWAMIGTIDRGNTGKGKR